jgi:hypothetical protein
MDEYNVPSPDYRRLHARVVVFVALLGAVQRTCVLARCFAASWLFDARLWRVVAKFVERERPGSWEGLELSAPLLAALRDLEVFAPMPLQAAAPPLLLLSQPVCLVSSGERAGKRLAAALAACHAASPELGALQALFVTRTTDDLALALTWTRALGAAKGLRVERHASSPPKPPPQVAIATPREARETLSRDGAPSLRLLVCTDAAMLSADEQSDLIAACASAPRAASVALLASAMFSQTVALAHALARGPPLFLISGPPWRAWCVGSASVNGVTPDTAPETAADLATRVVRRGKLAVLFFTRPASATQALALLRAQGVAASEFDERDTAPSDMALGLATVLVVKLPTRRKLFVDSLVAIADLTDCDARRAYDRALSALALPPKLAVMLVGSAEDSRRVGASITRNVFELRRDFDRDL